mmetsp:Transcript_11774/g.28195  ORF Transcript_11774/g.28195 Transcript_11774/m.28195 type:complete len:224 (-) Transcript_11774:1768-2439(-)
MGYYAFFFFFATFLRHFGAVGSSCVPTSFLCFDVIFFVFLLPAFGVVVSSSIPPPSSVFFFFVSPADVDITLLSFVFFDVLPDFGDIVVVFLSIVLLNGLQIGRPSLIFSGLLSSQSSNEESVMYIATLNRSRSSCVMVLSASAVIFLFGGCDNVLDSVIMRVRRGRIRFSNEYPNMGGKLIKADAYWSCPRHSFKKSTFGFKLVSTFKFSSEGIPDRIVWTR